MSKQDMAEWYWQDKQKGIGFGGSAREEEVSDNDSYVKFAKYVKLIDLSSISLSFLAVKSANLAKTHLFTYF